MATPDYHNDDPPTYAPAQEIDCTISRVEAICVVQAIAAAEREMQCDPLAVVFAKNLVLQFELQPEEFNMSQISGRGFVQDHSP